MKLFILRHGDAVESGDPRYKETERPLTSKGRQRTKQLASYLEEIGVTFDAMFSSPLVRARETAELVSDRLAGGRELVLTDHLAPLGSMEKLVGQVNGLHPHPDSVLLVGHEPYLGGLISLLCTGETHLQMAMKKGGLCRLHVDALACGRCAMLEWLLPPRLQTVKPAKK
ncbi:MAG: phosphohistidine phosphatase SixA [Verrucomicrobiota bacterium]